MVMRLFLLLCTTIYATVPSGAPLRTQEFSKYTLLNSPTKIFDPAKLSMQQSYTMSYTGNGQGTYSSGVYINHISYQIFQPVKLYVDLGVANMFHNTMQPNQSNQSNQLNDNQPNFIIPRIGLNYQATDNLFLSIQYTNLKDAWQAGNYYSPFGSFHKP